MLKYHKQFHHDRRQKLPEKTQTERANVRYDISIYFMLYYFNRNSSIFVFYIFILIYFSDLFLIFISLFFFLNFISIHFYGFLYSSDLFDFIYRLYYLFI